MYYKRNLVLLTKRESKILIEAIIETASLVWSKGYLKTLALIFHTLIVLKRPITKESLNRINMIRDRINLTPIPLEEKRGLYYRPLYDPSTPNEERERARQAWSNSINSTAMAEIDLQWGSDSMKILESFRDAMGNVELTSQITKWFIDNDTRWVPTDVGCELGELRLIVSN